MLVIVVVNWNFWQNEDFYLYHHLLEYTELMGMIPRKQVIKEYEKASLLLLPINKADNAAGRIPGKLFEMLRTGKNILVLGPDDGDVKSIVEMEKRGRSFEYDDKDLLMSYLTDVLLNSSESINMKGTIDKYSNKLITGKIAKYLDEMIYATKDA